MIFVYKNTKNNSIIKENNYFKQTNYTNHYFYLFQLLLHFLIDVTGFFYSSNISQVNQYHLKKYKAHILLSLS